MNNSPQTGLVPKLVWLAALSSIFLLLVGVAGAWYVLQLQSAASRILDWNVTSIRAAEELEIGVRELRTQINKFLLTHDPALLDEVPKLVPDVEHWIHESHRLVLTDREAELIEQLQKGFAEFQQEFAGLRVASKADAEVIARKLTNGVLTDKILRPAEMYLDYNEQDLMRSSKQNQALAERLALGLLLTGICGAVAGWLAGYGLARGINRTIVQLSIPVHDVAGQLNEVVGPVSIESVTNFSDLEALLRSVAQHVTAVVERLRQRERDALRAEQLAALGQMAAGLAHELRNPLMSMKLLVQSAQSQSPGQLDGADLDVLDNEIVRLEKLVWTFLDFARPVEPAKRPLEVSPVITSTIDLVSRQGRSRGISFLWEVPAESISVSADPMQLRQVILNLLLNALDAVPDQGVISVAVSTADGNAIIAVRDNGEGIPPQLKETLFEPFVSSKPTGIGLGLAICRQIVDAHGGKISVVNQPDSGAEFTIRLPALPADDTIGREVSRQLNPVDHATR